MSYKCVYVLYVLHAERRRLYCLEKNVFDCVFKLTLSTKVLLFWQRLLFAMILLASTFIHYHHTIKIFFRCSRLLKFLKSRFGEVCTLWLFFRDNLATFAKVSLSCKIAKAKLFRLVLREYNNNFIFFLY